MTLLLETHRSIALSLGARELMRREITDRVKLHCTRGSIWITVDNSHADIVLETGEQQEFEGPAVMVIEALKFAELAFVDELSDNGFSCD